MTPPTQIAAHNAAYARGGPGAPSHKLRLNRFADWSRGEFDRVMLPNKARRARGGVAARVSCRPPHRMGWIEALRWRCLCFLEGVWDRLGGPRRLHTHIILGARPTLAPRLPHAAQEPSPRVPEDPEAL